MSEPREAADAATLLAWYDRNARTLPWRIGPAARAAGVTPDPYRIWLSEIMLQQTTVAAVKPYFETFTTRWPTVRALAAAEDADVMAAWAGLGYYARARNLLKCARVVVENHDARFPDDHATLLTLPGIGRYTAAAIAAIAFDRHAVVVDGNVERVMARIHDEHTALPKAKPVLTAYATALTPAARPGDYAQAVMDLGATICTPKRPACGLCPWRSGCAAHAAGTVEMLPKKAPKTAKPTRLGIVYLARRTDGAWLLERRPDTGLLGGMLGWPGSDWGAAPEEAPPLEADWRTLSEEARHTFTHFHLRLRVRVATVGIEAQPLRGRFVPHSDFRPADLPTVFRKAYDLAAGDRTSE
jgi:A/G-specific adenine glycosylase